MQGRVDILDSGDGIFDIFGHPPDGQLPIWLSHEAVELLRWAVTVEANIYDSPLGGKNKAMEFMPSAAMARRWPDDKHGSERRQGWWGQVREELFKNNLIAEHGWSYLYPTETALALLENLPPDQECVRRTF